MVIKYTFGIFSPSAGAPTFKLMRPQTMNYPSSQTTEQPPDVCLAVVHPPSSNNRIYLIDNLLESEWNFALGLKPYLFLESSDGLFLGDGIYSLSIGFLGQLAFVQFEAFTLLELVSQKFEAQCDVYYPRLLRVELQP